MFSLESMTSPLKYPPLNLRQITQCAVIVQTKGNQEKDIERFLLFYSAVLQWIRKSVFDAMIIFFGRIRPND